jgi:hypothetical protein
MSSSGKPAGAKPKAAPYSPGFSIDDFQKMSEIFKAWADGSNLKWWVIAAGAGAIISAVGSIVEILHICWLAFRWLKGF